MRWYYAAALALALPALSACTTTDGHSAATHPEAAPYDADADAPAQLAAARAAAATEGKLMLVIFGANWCHDSRALAGWLQTPRFRELTDAHYKVVYVDAGIPQTGEGHHLDLAAELGVPDITGTPTLIVLGPGPGENALINTPEDARSWRNASTRSADEIFAALENWATLPR